MAKFKKTDFVNADDVIAKLPAARRARIEQRANELIVEEMTLKDLRRACELTQERMAETLGIGQEHVSRLEQRTDMLLSTLASYVKAMGGDLKLMVQFADREPVAIAHLADLFDKTPTEPAEPAKRPRRKRGSEVAPA